MKKLSLIIQPNPLLRTECDPVTAVTEDTRELIAGMEKIMKKYNGIGLAAPQVGVIQRVILINTKDGVLPMVNPQITKKSRAQETGEEGCLSLPDFFGPVKRHIDITVRFFDSQGAQCSLEASGLLARVIQHEIDHLNGVLFIDYLNPADVPQKYRDTH